jgi:hypothetical protein
MRAINKEDAMRILHGLTRLMKAGEGDVQRLQGKEPAELRLRIGDYRVRFREFSGAVRVAHCSPPPRCIPLTGLGQGALFGACAMRFCARAFSSVRVTWSWPTTSEKRCGRYLRASTR